MSNNGDFYKFEDFSKYKPLLMLYCEVCGQELIGSAYYVQSINKNVCGGCFKKMTFEQKYNMPEAIQSKMTS
jgi:hypothetical protein